MKELYKGFTEALKETVEKPPYLVFLFVSAFFVITAQITGTEFHQVWVFFLYSAIGSMWRYAAKDLQNQTSKGQKSYLAIIIVYHLGNAALIYGLLKSL